MQMKNKFLQIAVLITAITTGYFLNTVIAQNTDNNLNAIVHTLKPNNMKLGAFSISLSVKDLKVSKTFYEQLGFTVFAGSMDKKYLIMKNGNALVGLFQDMFQGNILTFNPGWDENAHNTESFDDIRDIQHQLRSSGLTLMSEADEKTSGPASLTLTDPDGNIILIDQHR